MNRIIATAALISATALAGVLLGQTTQPADSGAPTAAPSIVAPSAAAAPIAGSSTTAPEASAAPEAAQPPATMPSLSPDVAAELEKVRAGYATIKTFQSTGIYRGNLDIDGRTQNQSAAFSDSFALPNYFRHETENQVQYGSTGSGAYAYFLDRKNYVTWPMPPGRPIISNLDPDLAKLLRETDQGLLLAMSPDPAAELVRGADSVEKAADVTIDNVPCPALAMRFDTADVTVVMDSQTHVLRRLMVDMTRAAKLQGAQVIKSALFTYDYTNVKINADLPVAAFAWTPPAGATEIATAVDPTSLVGKPMPDFKCTALDGKPFSSDALKGSVTILDFWAIYCGPCKEELPHLDAIYQANKAAGLKAYALNEAEDPNPIQQFVSQTKLSIPVLLDSDQAVGKLFGADQAIPVTILVGKDGTIIHGYLGAGHEQEIAGDVAKALKAR